MRQSFRNVKYPSSCGLVTVLGGWCHFIGVLKWNGEKMIILRIFFTVYGHTYSVRVWLCEREWLHEPCSMLSENGPKYVDNDSMCSMVGVVVWWFCSRMTVR